MKKVNNNKKSSYNQHNRKSDFVQKNHDFCKEVYGENVWADVDQLEFDNKILDNQEILEYLLKMFQDKGSINFVCSPTNSGKTYGMNEVFKKLNTIEKNYTDEEILEMMKYQENPEKVAKLFKREQKQYMNVLMMPSNPQTVQVAKAYGMTCVVGNQETTLNVYENPNIASVYDKAATFIQELDNNKNLVINLVIDEAHELTCSTYRGSAISDLEILKKKVIEHGGTITYLTASYEPMVYLRGLDHVLFCNKRTDGIDFDELVLILNNTSQSIEEITLDYLKDKEALVRLNRKEGQKDLSEELMKMGVKSYYINSDEKNCIENKETKERNYKNKMFDKIINESILPADLKVGICTSVLEAGANIKGIGDETNQPYAFESVYVCRDSNDLSLISEEQFANRIRFHHKNNVIIMNNTVDDEEEVYDISLREIFKYYREFLDRQVEYFNCEIELLRKTTYKNVENIEECIQKDIEDKLNSKNYFDGLKNSLGGSIRYVDGKIVVDYKFFLNYCLNMYYRGLYRNIDKLKKELKRIFNKDVKVIEINEEVDVEINKTNIEDIKKNLLEQLKNNSPIFPWLYQTEFYKEAQTLCDISNKDINECIELVLKLDEKSLQNLYNTYSKIAMSKLSNREKKELEDVLDNNKQIKDIKDEETKDKIAKVVCNKKFKEKIYDGRKQGITTEEFITYYCKSEDEKEYSDYLKTKPILKNNQYFLDGYKEMLNDYSSQEQKCILEFFSNVKNTRIREKNLGKKMDNLDKLIDEMRRTIKDKKKYTRRNVLNFIKKIYTYREDVETVKGKKVKCIYLNSIRTKY